jgi:molybdopterin/thiamine biosynthesis adenylyltransferase
MENKPTILSGLFTREELEKFKADHKVWKTVDIYEQQLAELAEINAADETVQNVAAESDLQGAWVYYPWSGILLHCVGEVDLFALRTNRNQNLITRDEQQKLAASTIAVAGMSVGSGVALACIYSGISNSGIKIADFDTLSTANLNRLRESLPNVGLSKTMLAAQHIYEINPFAGVQEFPGVTDENIDAFFQDPDTAVVVDEIDDFKMKVQLRVHAKQHHVPLLMFTSLGDNILVDVERYDKNPDQEIFNGAIGQLPDEILQNGNISPEDVKRYAVQLVGQEYVPTKAMGSLLEIGKTLVGRPQLFSTIAVDGGLAAYVIKSIVLGAPLESGRYFVKFSELFNMPNTDLGDSPERQDILSKLFSK